jgi:hypothetical protein
MRLSYENEHLRGRTMNLRMLPPPQTLWCPAQGPRPFLWPSYSPSDGYVPLRRQTKARTYPLYIPPSRPYCSLATPPSGELDFYPQRAKNTFYVKTSDLPPSDFCFRGRCSGGVPYFETTFDVVAVSSGSRARCY